MRTRHAASAAGTPTGNGLLAPPVWCSVCTASGGHTPQNMTQNNMHGADAHLPPALLQGTLADTPAQNSQLATAVMPLLHACNTPGCRALLMMHHASMQHTGTCARCKSLLPDAPAASGLTWYTHTSVSASMHTTQHSPCQHSPHAQLTAVTLCTLVAPANRAAAPHLGGPGANWQPLKARHRKVGRQCIPEG